jgi:hypothetical protein
MNFKVFVIISVLLLLCLFAVGVGVGARGRGGLLPTLDLQTDWASWVRTRLTTKLRSSELIVVADQAAGCVVATNQLLVPENTTCQWVIPASDRTTRQLQLQVSDTNSNVTALLEQPNALRLETTLTVSSTVTPFDIYRNSDGKGATLTLRDCQVSSTAAVTTTENVATDAPNPYCTLTIQ